MTSAAARPGRPVVVVVVVVLLLWSWGERVMLLLMP